jgi:hypothetical protein
MFWACFTWDLKEPSHI